MSISKPIDASKIIYYLNRCKGMENGEQWRYAKNSKWERTVKTKEMHKNIKFQRSYHKLIGYPTPIWL